jgi:hypothetical protein
MPFGITGRYKKSDGKTIKFEAPYADRRATIEAFSSRSIEIIRFYEHGAPGLIGDDDVDALAGMLQDKMQPDGQIHLLGCSTGGVDASNPLNPVGGIGLLARMIMYHGVPKWMGNGDLATLWAENLAKDLSRRVPNVYVLGLGGISFPLSRIMESREGYEPRGLMADRLVYYNSQLTELPN